MDLPEATVLRARLRDFALSLPKAVEEFPWGEVVIKVHRKIFVFLGSEESAEQYGFTVKLVEPAVHEQALSVPGAAPSGYGLGRAGWVTVPFGAETPPYDVLADWVEESYRVVAPKRLVAELDRGAG